MVRADLVTNLQVMCALLEWGAKCGETATEGTRGPQSVCLILGWRMKPQEGFGSSSVSAIRVVSSGLTKTKNFKWHYQESKSSGWYSSEEKKKKVKRKSIEWEKLFANHISEKGFVSRIYKEPLGTYILVVLVVKNPPANAGDIRHVGSIPGLGRSAGGGNGNPLQYSCLENPIGQRSLAGYSP